tara:strand:- start:441 stop:1025 length:585 start_codon:yes stop_codon:yes gene_type:complete
MTQKPAFPRTLNIPTSLLSAPELSRLLSKAEAAQREFDVEFGPEPESDLDLFIGNTRALLADYHGGVVSEYAHGDFAVYCSMSNSLAPLNNTPDEFALQSLGVEFVKFGQRAVDDLNHDELIDAVEPFTELPPKIMAHLLLAFMGEFMGEFIVPEGLSSKNITAIRASCDFAEVLGPDWADIIEDFFSKVATIA